MFSPLLEFVVTFGNFRCAGVEGPSREPEGCSGSHEESICDEQDSEADQCWNRADEMMLFMKSILFCLDVIWEGHISWV